MWAGTAALSYHPTGRYAFSRNQGRYGAQIKPVDPSLASIDLDYPASAIDLVYLCQKAATMAQYRSLIHGAFVRDFAVVE